MDILFVTATLPYPPTDGAKIRLFSLIKNLAVHHKVSVVSFVTPSDTEEAVKSLGSHCKEVIVVPKNPAYSLSTLLWGLVSPTPFPILNYWNPAMAAAIRRIVESNKFDIVQAETLQAAQYCARIKSRTVLDLFDIQSVVMRRYAKQQVNPLKSIYAYMTAGKLSNYERTICSQFDHCLTSSPDDKEVLEKATGLSNVTVIPNGVDLDACVLSKEESEDDNRIVFVGRMDYAANVDGIHWFCRKVFPLIRAQHPKVVLQIVGKYPNKGVRRLAIPGQIEVTGYVEDVRPNLRAAAVSVVPLKVAGGTRLKILEGLAMGKAIVSTTMGAEGLAVTPGKNILIADSEEAFARHVIHLLKDVALRNRLGRAGRRLAEEHYGWSMIGRRLEELYERILSKP
jgi:sugar transferase (PEP-CTERM/EpsH1 system associated)